MGMNRPKNEQMKPIIMAIGAAAAAAIAAMLVPVGIIESITGATGLSELIPATAAPLGAKARAIIAFFAGVVTMMLAMGYLMRRSPDAQMQANQSELHNMQSTAKKIEVEDGNVSLFTKLQSRLSNIKTGGIKLPAMPWAKKNDNDILDLADLPNLRVQDSHPDAPSRRPISALSDLADADLTKPSASLPSPSLASSAVPAAAPVFETAPISEPVTAPVQEPVYVVTAPVSEPAPLAATASEHVPFVKSEKQPLAELIAQLQTAIEGRLELVSKIEALSAEVNAVKAMSTLQAAPVAASETFSTPPIAPTVAPSFVETQAVLAQNDIAAQVETAEPEPEPAPAPTTAYTRPPLEAVPTPARTAQDDEMDAALNAALETLQRMNVQAR
jgi:hypothetical protein